MLENVDRALEAISETGRHPVIVIDDSDSFTRRQGSGSTREQLIEAFFGPVLRALTALHAGVIVAVHEEYLDMECLQRTRQEHGALERLLPDTAPHANWRSRVPSTCTDHNRPQPANELRSSPQATRALQPPKTSTEGRRIVKRHTPTRGSPSCDRDPHTTLRVAARWPPLPAPEASGCALLATATSRRARTRTNAAARRDSSTRAPGRASRVGLPRRGHPAAPAVPQAYWRSGSSGRARSARSRPG